MESSRIIRDSLTGKSRGFGFVNLKKIEDYNELLKHKQEPLYFKGKILKIK